MKRIFIFPTIEEAKAFILTEPRDPVFVGGVGMAEILKTGTLTAKASAGNGQIRYGADVINRIVEQGKPGGTKRLQDAILKETLLPLVAAMCKSAGIPVSRVFRV